MTAVVRCINECRLVIGNYMKKFLTVLVVLVLFVTGSVAYRWYSYVTNTDNPYDEVGIAFNSRMPYPLRKWGCDKLHRTFSDALPPVGCRAEGQGREWL